MQQIYMLMDLEIPQLPYIFQLCVSLPVGIEVCKMCIYIQYWCLWSVKWVRNIYIWKTYYRWQHWQINILSLISSNSLQIKILEENHCLTTKLSYMSSFLVCRSSMWPSCLNLTFCVPCAQLVTQSWQIIYWQWTKDNTDLQAQLILSA